MRFCICAALLFLTSTPSLTAPAWRAEDFLNSVCVGTKLGQGQNLERVTAAIKYIGARCIREAANASTASLLHIHNETGARVNLLSGPNPSAGFVTLIDKAKSLLPKALLSVEGPNEPNNFAVTYDGETCGRGTTSWLCIAKLQRDLFAAWNAIPELRHYPVIGVSEVGAEFSNAGLQWNKIPDTATGTDLPPGTAYADYANAHNYACCYHLQGHTLTADNVAWRAATLAQSPPFGGGWYNQHILTWRQKYSGYTLAQSGGVPKVSTETGWITDGTPEGDDLQARMIANIYLSQFAKKWKKTYIYEAMDHGSSTWGLYRAGTNWGPRPAADTVHRITSWLADSGGSFLPGSANVALLAPPSYVHALLLQKSTGTFEYVIWGEKASGTVQQTVTLGQTYPAVRVYDPVTDTIEFEGAAQSVTLTVGLGPKIVEFR